MKKVRKERRRKEEQFLHREILKVCCCFLVWFGFFHCYNVRMAKVHFPHNTAKSWGERCLTNGEGHRLFGIQRLREALIPKMIFCISLFIKLHKAIAALNPRSLYCLPKKLPDMKPLADGEPSNSYLLFPVFNFPYYQQFAPYFSLKFLFQH